MYVVCMYTLQQFRLSKEACAWGTHNCTCTVLYCNMPSVLIFLLLMHMYMFMCPSRELAVSLEVEKANGQLLLQTDTVSTWWCTVWTESNAIQICHASHQLYVKLSRGKYMYKLIHVCMLSFSLQPCPTTDDGIFTLADLLFSTKVYLFLCPLQSAEPFQSLQVNTVPLSFSLQHEGTHTHAHTLSWIVCILPVHTATYTYSFSFDLQLVLTSQLLLVFTN